MAGSPGRLLKVLATGGTPEVICTVPGDATRNMEHGQGSLLSVETGFSGFRLAADSLRRSGHNRSKLGVQQSGPSFLPDGRHVVFFQYSRTATDQGELYVGSIDGEGPTRRSRSPIHGGLRSRKSGQLLFVRQSTLFAQPLDLKGLRLTGDPVAVTSHIATSVLIAGRERSPCRRRERSSTVSEAIRRMDRCSWSRIDQHGTNVGTFGPPADYRGVDLSPDGTRVATHVHNPQGGDIWTIDTSVGQPRDGR